MTTRASVLLATLAVSTRASDADDIAAKLLDQLGRVPANTRRTAGHHYRLVAEKLAVGPVS